MHPGQLIMDIRVIRGLGQQLEKNCFASPVYLRREVQWLVVSLSWDTSLWSFIRVSFLILPDPIRAGQNATPTSAYK